MFGAVMIPLALVAQPDASLDVRFTFPDDHFIIV